MSHDATDEPAGDPVLRPENADGSGCAEALDLFARYLILCEQAAAERDARPDFEAWLRGHPEHAEELRALQADWGSLDDLLGMALGRAGSSPDRRSEGSSPGPMELAPGLHVGSYRLIERIGHGGMGEVWSAEELPPRGRQGDPRPLRARSPDARLRLVPSWP